MNPRLIPDSDPSLLPQRGVHIRSELGIGNRRTKTARLAVLALLLLPAFASAQDMPLFTIAKSGETWKPATGARPKTPSSWVDTSPDGGTVFQANWEIGFLYAYSASADPKAAPGLAPYAQLRIEQGYDNGKAAQEKRKKDPPKTRSHR